MSIVIVGGHDRMVCRYKEICESYDCRAKIFTKMPSDLKRKIGSPDVLILFTSTLSHKMLHCAVAEAKRKNTKIIRSHSSSGSALNEMLKNHVA